ncbi:MAG: capsid protein [Wigfec virus K19_426]|nr:MAG: capsid protein [Wigfec virus K19_426]
MFVRGAYWLARKYLKNPTYYNNLAGRIWRHRKHYVTAVRAARSVGLASQISRGIKRQGQSNQDMPPRKRGRMAHPIANPDRLHHGPEKGTIIESTAFPDHVQRLRTKYAPRKLSKAMKLLGNRATFEVIDTVGSVSLMGLQSGAVWANIYKQTDIQDLYNKAAAQWNATALARVTLNASTAPTYSANRFLLSNVNAELRLCNQTPGPIELDIYVLISKINQAAASNCITDWNTDQQNERGNNVVAQTLPYCKPTGTIFNRNWKRIKTYHVHMGPGCTHQLNWSFSPNRVMDMDYVKDFATIKGISSQILVVQRGTLGDDQNSKTVGTISIGPSKLIGSLHTRFTSQLLNFFPKNYYQVSDYAVGVEIANMYQQNETEVVEDVLLATNYA